MVKALTTISEEAMVASNKGVAEVHHSRLITVHHLLLELELLLALDLVLGPHVSGHVPRPGHLPRHLEH